MNLTPVFRTVVLWFFCLLFLVSCAPKQTEFVSQRILKVIGERPPIDDDLATLAPAGLQGATWINLATMRKSPLWPTLESLLETYYSNELFSRETVLHILRHADEVLAVSGHRNKDEADGFVTLLKADWETDEIIDRLIATRAFKVSPGDSGKMLEMSHVRIFAVTARTLAIVSDNLLDALNGLMMQKGKSLRDDKNFKELNLPEKGGSIARYMRGDSKLNTQSFRGLPAAYRKYAKDAESANFVFRISDAIAVRGNIRMSSDRQAEQVKKSVERELKAISSNVLIAMLGVKSLIKKLNISTRSNRVHVSMGLTQKDVKKILQLVEPLMQLRQML